jgi:hypothetical protein
MKYSDIHRSDRAYEFQSENSGCEILRISIMRMPVLEVHFFRFENAAFYIQMEDTIALL